MDLGGGVKWSKSNFFRTWSCCISNKKANHECSNMIANILPADLPQTQGVGSKGQNSTFSEHGHNAYQIKWNHECSKMVANIFACRPPPRTLRSKVQNSAFPEHGHVAYQIKGITNAASWLQIFCPQAPSPDPGVGSKGPNSTFSEHGHVEYHIKWNHKCRNMVANILPAYILPDPEGGVSTLTLGGVRRSNFTFLEHGHDAYQIKGNQECLNMVANILPAYASP